MTVIDNLPCCTRGQGLGRQQQAEQSLCLFLPSFDSQGKGILDSQVNCYFLATDNVLNMNRRAWPGLWGLVGLGNKGFLRCSSDKTSRMNWTESSSESIYRGAHRPAKVPRQQRIKQLPRTENKEVGHCGWSRMNHRDRRWKVGRHMCKAGGRNMVTAFYSRNRGKMFW